MASVDDRTRRIVKTKKGNGYVIRFKGMAIFTPKTSFKVTKSGPKAVVTYTSGGATKPKVEVKVGNKVEKDWVVYFTNNYKATKENPKGISKAERLNQIKK